MLLCTLLVWGPLPQARALPTGAEVVLGTAAISTDAGAMTVVQESDLLAIDWASFGVGSGESLVFVQPGAASTALNRVLGSGPSEILGRLSANGQVFIVNPQGVLFGRDAHVDVGGLAASSLALSVEDFAAGRYQFGGAASHTPHSGVHSLTDDVVVRNDGHITAADGGYIALLGHRVDNQGSIVAEGGTVILGAGELVRLELVDGSMLGFAIDEAALGAMVQQGGAVIADGGLVLLTAHGRDALLDTVINVDGVIRARSIGEDNGQIVIGGGPEGRVAVNGAIDASSVTSGGTGGRIEITGEHIEVGGDTDIDARGRAGGGEVLIGGDYQGANSAVRNARTLVVEAGARIDASAIDAGDGGRVILWSDEATHFAGHLAARGGDAGGDGGFAEVSGKVNLSYAGISDLRAPAGRAGSLLLDPKNFSIKASGGDMTPDAIAAQLALGDLIIMTSDDGKEAGDIFVSDELTVANNHLTLRAHRNIHLEAPIALVGDVNLTLRADAKGTGVGTIVADGPESVVTAPDGNVYAYFNPDDFELEQELPWVEPVGGRRNAHVFYLINSIEDLQAIGSSSRTRQRDYALGRDIDAGATAEWNDGQGFIPIASYSGILDGLGHVIDGLTISSDGDAGLFSVLHGEVRNIGLTGVNVVSNSSHVGALVAENYGTIRDVYVAGGEVGGAHRSGGLVGANRGSGTITHSYADVEVSAGPGGDMAGGLAGQNEGNITHSYSLGTVSVETYGGSLVGFNFAGGTIEFSYATGNVDENVPVRGGLVAGNAGTISSSYWDTDTTGVGIGSNEVGAGVATALIGRTSQQMRTKSQLNNFDFDDEWYMIDGATRPFLRSEYSTTIRNAHQLQLVHLDTKADYVLGRDIDLSVLNRSEAHWNPRSGFYPIGLGSGFSGTFDGAGHVISNLKVVRTGPAGLFGTTMGGATIRRIGLIDPGIEVGPAINSHGGALVGFMTGGTVSESYSAGGSVVGTGAQNLGGLVGAMQSSSTIENAYSTTEVSGTASAAGGLVGSMSHQSKVTNAYSAGSVDVFCEGECDIGGFVGGMTSNATVENSFWDTEASGQSQSAGGTGLTTAEMQTKSTFTNAGWNFSRLWTIDDDNSYPYFGEALYKIISGILAGIDSVADIATLRIIINGSLLDETVQTDAEGNYVFELEPDAWGEGDVLVIFVEAGSGDPGNVVVLSDGDSHEGVDIYRNAVSWRAYIASAGSNTEMLDGIGDLSHDRILYSGTASADGSDIVFDEGVEGLYFYVLDPFVLDGDLTAKDGHIWFGDLLLVAREQAAMATNGFGGTGGTILFQEIQSEGDSDRSLRVDSGSGSILFNSSVDLKGLYITSSGTVNQTEAPGVGMNVDQLLLLGDGTYSLTGDNVVTTVAGDAGSVWLAHTGAGTALEVGTIEDYAGLHVSGTLALHSSAGITLKQSVTAHGEGNAIVLNTGGYLTINESAGVDAISTPNGRYLVYALDHDGMSFGQVQSPGNLFGRTYAGNPPSMIEMAFGSRFVYENQPTLTVTANDVSREYGEQNPDLTFEVEGLVDGDTVVTALTGGLSTVAALASSAGSYVIEQGGLVELLGYTLVFNEGTLTVTKAPLTVQAGDASRPYGAANPQFTVTYDGFKLGEDESVLSGTLLFETEANPASRPGEYLILPSGLEAENYAIVFVDGTLVVLPLPQDNVVEPSQIGVAERVRQSGGSGDVDGDGAGDGAGGTVIDEFDLTDIDVGREEFGSDLELRIGDEGDVEIAAFGDGDEDASTDTGEVGDEAEGGEEDKDAETDADNDADNR